MRACALVVTGTVVVLAGVSTALAQTWTGAYAGGSIGAGLQRGDVSEIVVFDTNLDGTFTDTVRTVAGANAFSPGFCGGLAVNSTFAGGCTDDEDGVDFGGRVGYDGQAGRLVVGGLVDVSRNDVIDSVTAFSTTPAFYSFTRQLNYLVGFRGRAGFGSDRVLIYGTGGGAWANVEQPFTTSNGVNTFVAVNSDAGADDDGVPNENVWGYQAGGGVEVRVGARWSLTGEYLLTSLDNRDRSTIRSQGPAPATNPFILVNAAGTELQRTEKFDVFAVRFALSYRF